MAHSAPSFFARVYYRVKPFVPRRLRWILRRSMARKIRPRSADVWPIDRSCASAPDGWPGWPEEKEFAVVLTHDVESQVGLDQVRPLAELELELGFRSSFNFIPEGEYQIPDALREWLVENGFEVGIHDLHHDGNLYSSREVFRQNADRINHYLKEWNACGFRSGFMLRRLGWLHDLDILYDCSTFDTDPFEPQPDGAGTIFPFRVPKSGAGGKSGYIELPYTLAQDSTLYLLLGEDSPAIWNRKLDWIVERRGMALVNVHPDYINFGADSADDHKYSSSIYRDWLEGLRDTYKGRYWHCVAREMAEFSGRVLPAGASVPEGSGPGSTSARPTIWIDLDNTPHVPFFAPIIEELQARHYPVMVTVRDAFQVCELADQHGLSYTKIGHHNGRQLWRKAAGLLRRSLQLMPMARREKPAISVSHGSRAQLLASRLMDIPSLELTDYEHAQSGGLLRPDVLMAPESLAGSDLARRSVSFRSYPGLKEDVYAWRLGSKPVLPDSLGINSSQITVTVRPPATEAHYHQAASDRLFECFMERAIRTADVKVVLLPRNEKQEEDLRARFPHWFKNGSTIIPGDALDGLALIWHSDVVVSGGGTMNREAAALGVPVYSIFRGATGAVDRQLQSEGRLVMVESEEEIETKIKLEKRRRPNGNPNSSKQALNAIVDAIIEFANQ